MILPDPQWPPTMAIIQWAGGVPVQVPLHESLAFRWDLDELERAITPKTKVLYLNSPNNPSGGSLTRADLERLAAIARERNLWVVSDEAYEDVLFNAEHISIASLPGMYERTIPVLHAEQVLRDDRRARRLLRDQGPGDAGPGDQAGALHGQQRQLDRPVRRDRRPRGLAAVPRRLQDGAEGPARPLLRRPARRRAARSSRASRPRARSTPS